MALLLATSFAMFADPNLCTEHGQDGVQGWGNTANFMHEADLSRLNGKWAVEPFIQNLSALLCCA